MSENDKKKAREISRLMAINNMYESLINKANKLMAVSRELVELAEGLWDFESFYNEEVPKEETRQDT